MAEEHPTDHKARVSRVAYAPDSGTLATASSDNTVRLWNVSDLARPHPLGPPLRHRGEVYAVAFAPDGRTLATGGAGGQGFLWNLATLNDLRNRPLQSACTLAGRGLNRSEWARYVAGLPYQNTCPP